MKQSDPGGSRSIRQLVIAAASLSLLTACGQVTAPSMPEVIQQRLDSLSAKTTLYAKHLASGDVALPVPSVSFAVADGVRAGISARQSLVFRREPELVEAS